MSKAHPNPHLKPQPFTRPTIIAAIEFLGAASSQAKFDQVIVRLGLNNEIPLASPKSVTAKNALLAQAVTQRATHVIDTINGQMALAESVVLLATMHIRRITSDQRRLRIGRQD